MNTRAFAIGGLAVAAFIGATAYAMTRGSTTNHDTMPAMTGMGNQGTSGTGTMPGMLPVGDVSGLRSSADGYMLKLATTTLSVSSPARVSFRILTAHGKPVSDFQVEATKRMHLTIARRDLTNYRHLHPTMASDGTWSINASVHAPGDYRAFADFATGGKRHVLGSDLTAPGTSSNEPLPAPRPTALVDGYAVTLHAGMLMTGTEAAMRFTISRNGQAVATLEPYLGNLGHLVILREKTLQYLHVHPTSSGGAGPDISFAGDLTHPGLYRAFLQFQINGTVHTAAFTVEVHAAM
jgi:hypothetical protein